MGFRDMDALLQSFVENGPAGCGCAIARKGEILYEGYFGYANKERETACYGEYRVQTVFDDKDCNIYSLYDAVRKREIFAG